MCIENPSDYPRIHAHLQLVRKAAGDHLGYMLFFYLSLSFAAI